MKLDLDGLPWIKLEEDFHVHDRIMKNLIKETPVILEAGCCSGDDTLKFKEIWPDCTIYAFEPVPELFQMVSNRVKAKDLKDVIITNKALSDKPGEIKFYQSEKIPGASSLLKDNLINLPLPIKSQFKNPQVELSYFDKEIIVECTTADTFFQNENLKKPNYIWLDSEGYELQILKGATSILKNVNTILSEVNFQEFRIGMTMFEDLYYFLMDNGFTLKHIWGNPEWQGNAIFTR